MTLHWYGAGTDEPRDEQADLKAGYWALIGPLEDGQFSYVIIGPDGKDVRRAGAGRGQ